MRIHLTVNRTPRLLSYGLLVAGCSLAMRAQDLPGNTPAAGGEGAPMVAVPPPSAAEVPPKAPQIRCEGNQLTIAADNSTMSSVLAGIRACIGIEIQLPNGSGDERTYIHLGPGSVREVLDDLLLATDYNFVIQSSNSSPGRVTNVVLTARTNEASDKQDSRGPSLRSAGVATPRRALIASPTPRSRTECTGAIFLKFPAVSFANW